jgi:tetratricopeptide (TPR) repeat protein
MRRTLTPLGMIVLIIAVATTSLLLILALGSIRYGGPKGLVLRVRAELADHRPHPQFVPTPLPTQTGRSAMVTSAAETGLGAGIMGSTPERVPLFTPPTAGTRAPATPKPEIAKPTSLPPTSIPAEPPAPSPTPAHHDVRPSVQLSGFTHAWQKWNNCGPATLAMCFSYFGSSFSQDDLASALKGNQDDKNVSPEEMVAFARSQGFNAMTRVNGDFDLLRMLLSNGIPAMIETWHEDEPGDGMGHYRLVTGYDEASRHLTVFDSYVSEGVRSDRPYDGIRMSYDDVWELWGVFNRAYVLIYTNDMEPVVRSILGDELDVAVMWQRALVQAQAELKERPEDPFAWFNLGTDLAALGRFEEAVQAYDRARVIGLPWRMLWYQFGPFRAYYETGQYEALISLTDATIRTAGNIEETYYWKGLGLAATGNVTAARQAWERSIELNASYSPASDALAKLEQPQPESMLNENAGAVEDGVDFGG